MSAKIVCLKCSMKRSEMRECKYAKNLKGYCASNFCKNFDKGKGKSNEQLFYDLQKTSKFASKKWEE